jgi:hypothetical protein
MRRAALSRRVHVMNPELHHIAALARYEDLARVAAVRPPRRRVRRLLKRA